MLLLVSKKQYKKATHIIMLSYLLQIEPAETIPVLGLLI